MKDTYSTKNGGAKTTYVLGNAGQTRMGRNGWRLELADSYQESAQDMYNRLSERWEDVRIYEATTCVRGIHELFAMCRGDVVTVTEEPEATPEEVETTGESREHCQQIAEDLEAYADGRVYRCPKCGEHIKDNILFCDCGEQVDLISGDWEQLGFYDFLEDCFDIEYRMENRDTLRSVQIMVACGGPNIYIDTATKQVELYWWTDRASYPIRYDVCDTLNEWAEEMWGL